MREEYIKTIREACVGVNPEIEDWVYHEDVGGSLGGHKEARTIRLADVLLAITSNRIRLGTFVHGDAWFEIYEESNVHTHEQAWKAIGVKWNLRKDSFTDQSDECLRFLAELLATKE